MFAVQDPRSTSAFDGAGKYQVTPFDQPAGTVIGASTTGQGAFAVADPRSAMNNRTAGDAYLTGGHYGVVPWDGTSGAVSASASYDNGRWSVADPRIDALPALDQKTVAIIRALDGTWHRPFTTLELAALQSLIEPEEYLLLDGMSDSVWREHIGNLVPPDAATAIAEVMGTTLLLARAGETFVLDADLGVECRAGPDDAFGLITKYLTRNRHGQHNRPEVRAHPAPPDRRGRRPAGVHEDRSEPGSAAGHRALHHHRYAGCGRCSAAQSGSCRPSAGFGITDCYRSCRY
jgi:hypothetical protein